MGSLHPTIPGLHPWGGRHFQRSQYIRISRKSPWVGSVAKVIMAVPSHPIPFPESSNFCLFLLVSPLRSRGNTLAYFFKTHEIRGRLQKWAQVCFLTQGHEFNPEHLSMTMPSCRTQYLLRVCRISASCRNFVLPLFAFVFVTIREDSPSAQSRPSTIFIPDLEIQLQNLCYNR